MATSLLTQYAEMKKKHPDAVLLFRVGDFYETFSDDAIIASEILGITLTRRANGRANTIELAGFPHHALDTYLPKLVRAGKRVAICEQLEDPKLAQKPVKREIEYNAPQKLEPGQTRLSNGLIIGEKQKLSARPFNTQENRFIIHDGKVGIFMIEPGNNWYFAPFVLSPEDEAKYKLYTELSWKYSEWIWVDEYGEDEELLQYYNELNQLYSDFVSRYGFLNAPENAKFIKLDAYADNLEILEKEFVCEDGTKAYTRGKGFEEICERVNEILENTYLSIYAPFLASLTLLSDAMAQLYIYNEICRKTKEIRDLSRKLRLHPKHAFNACFDEISKIPQKSLFDNI